MEVGPLARGLSSRLPWNMHMYFPLAVTVTLLLASSLPLPPFASFLELRLPLSAWPPLLFVSFLELQLLLSAWLPLLFASFHELLVPEPPFLWLP